MQSQEHWNVVIAAFEAHASVAEGLAERLRASWRATTPAQFSTSNAEDLTGDALKKTAAIILVGDCSLTQSTMLAVLDAWEESSIPMLALLDGPVDADHFLHYAGALVDQWNADDHRLCALLHGMMHRQAEVKRLAAEAAMNQRFHGGLKGQISKMHEELQLAAIVQREFLPRDVPTTQGVDFAALWRPTNYVSGDIYDLIRLDEDHVGVFVADAVGHGVPAALMTMVICRSLITKEITGNTYRIIPPSEVLARLNAEMIRRQGHSTRFVTAVYAVVNCRERTVQMAGAGHPPPVRLRSDGASETLETTGGLLGVFPDEMFHQVEFELAIGDRLLFYTDGFEQAFPTGATDRHQRCMPTNQYRDEFNQLGQLPSAAEMIEHINRRLDDQAGSLHQVDDLTLICAHAGPLVAFNQTEDSRLTSAAADHTRSLPRHAGELRLAT